MDELKAQIEKKIGGRISDFAYFNVVKSLSDEFGIPLDCIQPVHEYWFTKDPSVLTEEAKKWLLECSNCFYQLAEREDDGQE